MAGVASGRSYLCSIMYALFGPEVSLSTKGSYGTCGRWSPLGSGGYGSFGHVSYNPEGQSSHQPVRRPLEQVDTAINDIQTVSEMGFVPSPTESSDSRMDMGRMRPAGQMEEVSGEARTGCWVKHDLARGLASYAC